MNAFVPTGGRPDVFADRMLADYSVIIDAANPNSTNYDESQVEADRERLADYFEVIPVTTVPDKFETALIVEEAMGNFAAQCVVRARTGDSGNVGPVRAAMGRKVPIWQELDGFANNFGRACFGITDRGEMSDRALKRLLDRARIARTKPLLSTVMDAEGNVVYQESLTDQFDVGDMAHAQTAREDPKHREHIKGVSRIRKLASTGRVGGLAIIGASDFKIVREEPSLGTEALAASQVDESDIDPSQIEVYNELAFTNLRELALGRVQGIRMTDRKLVEFSNRYRTTIGALTHYAKLFSFGVRGTDIPDGEQVQFKLLSDSNAQGSGDPFAVLKGWHVNIKRNEQELLVVTTKERP
jgi:hypothetical protein